VSAHDFSIQREDWSTKDENETSSHQFINMCFIGAYDSAVGFMFTSA